MFCISNKKLYLCNQLIMNRMRNSVSEKAPLVKIAVSLMAGIVLAKYLVVPFPLFPLLVVVVLLAFCLWRYEQLQSAVIGLCMVVLGALLMQRARTDCPRVGWMAVSMPWWRPCHSGISHS